MKPRSYGEAGVDIQRGDRFASFISSLSSKAVSPSIGGFAGELPFDNSGYRNPVMLATTDGVGTKLLVAKRLTDYSTIGIDLVAMCVNDLAVAGADPLLFLDYIACGQIDESTLADIVSGIVKGCEESGCILAGGETAEMPDMYGGEELDLAGFAVGIVERDEKLPRLQSVTAGDVLIGLKSSGIHSNGFSLARKVLHQADDSAWRELLKPTRIYVSEMRLLRSHIKAAAHITGGGLPGNIARVIPETLRARLTWEWDIPAIFATIQKAADVPDTEMRNVFNMGIGLVAVVSAEREAEVVSLVGGDAVRIGEIADG